MPHSLIGSSVCTWACQRFPEVLRLTTAQCEVLELIHSIANHDGLYLDMDFERGDMRFLKNAVILHAPRECEDWNEPERKRHLLRQWLTNNSFKGGGPLRCAKAYGLRKRHDT